MAKRKNSQGPIPYVILGSDYDQNVRFYERYDVDLLFNKVATFLYILNAGESAVKQIEEHLVTAGGAQLSERYLESIRAEMFFTSLHQCESFFAFVIALFQPLPHWVYLTTYETREIKEAIEQIVAGKVSYLTDGKVANIQDFVKVAVYSEVTTADPQLASRWEENIDNAAWLIKRIGKFFLTYDRAYNSYKHGLRVMTGPHSLSVAPQNPDGTPRGPMRIIQASEDALTYLQREPAREVEGEKEIPISEVTKVFNPFEASFYMAKMNQMLVTIRATRLAALRGDGEAPRINTFFGLDRDQVRQQATYGEWKVGPMRADEARMYSLLVDQMRTSAEQAKQQDDTADMDDVGCTPLSRQGLAGLALE